MDAQPQSRDQVEPGRGADTPGEWFLACGAFAGGVAGFVGSQVMFYIGNGNNFSFWFFAIMASVVVALFLAVANAIGGLLSWLVLRCIRVPLSRLVRGALAGAGMVILGLLPALLLGAMSPRLHLWLPTAVASSCASAVCVVIVVVFVKVKPPGASSGSDRRTPGIRL
jgi:hypothetical protein